MNRRPTQHHARITRGISELLESDDEYPDNYDEETAEIPAYLKDRRFLNVEKIVKEDLYDKPDNSINKHTEQQNCSQKNLVIEPSTRKLDHKKVLISKGVLTKRDIFCVKSVLEYTTDVTLLWFINYLFYKNVQPCQTSCLVADWIDSRPSAIIEPSSDAKKGYCLKLVVN